MKKSIFSTLAVMLFSSLSSAAIISLNITEAGSPSDVDMSTSDLAGAPGVRAGYWNNIASLNGQTLLGADAKYDNGTSVGGAFQADFDADRSTHLSGLAVTNDELMFRGTNQPRDGQTATFTLTNIPFANYEIYVYAGETRVDNGGSISDGTTTFYQRDDGTGTNPLSDGSGYIEMTTTSLPALVTDVTFGNYAVFENLSGSSQTITFSALDMGNSTPDYQRFNVNGIQIVQVPEASSLLFLLMGGVATLFLRRRSS